MIVPGHGPVLRDKTHIYLIRDLIRSALEQMNDKLRHTGPAMFQNFDDIKSGVDLSSLGERFAGNDNDLGAAFDDEASRLIKLAFDEARLR